MQDSIHNETIHDYSNKENGVNETIERFFSGDKIELKSGFAGFKVCWFGGKYDPNCSINNQTKEECFRRGDWDYVNRGARVLLLDEKDNPIGHADWRISESEEWVLVNGNKPSISPWIIEDENMPNFDLKEKTPIKGNWTNAIDLQEEFQGKGLGKLLIALQLVLLKRYSDQGKKVSINLQGNQKEVVQHIYEFFIPQYQKIYSQISGNTRTQEILSEQIDWDKVYEVIKKWLN